MTKALISAGRVIGSAETVLTGTVAYGYTLPDGRAIHELGRARLTVAARHLRALRNDPELPRYAVNIGGGRPS